LEQFTSNKNSVDATTLGCERNPGGFPGSAAPQLARVQESHLYWYGRKSTEQDAAASIAWPGRPLFALSQAGVKVLLSGLRCCGQRDIPHPRRGYLAALHATMDESAMSVGDAGAGTVVTWQTVFW